MSRVPPLVNIGSAQVVNIQSALTAEGVPEWVRREANRLLRHYPLCGELTQHLDRLRVLAAARTP